jgi:endonuclease YncB( thermonuclease family)
MFGLSFGGKVTRVLDGDTLEVEVRRTVRIRLLDCWAPETRTRDAAEKVLGKAAKAALVELALSRDVRVDVPIEAQGKFGDAMSMGRVLGHVYLGDLSLAEVMVMAGHATATKGGR